MSEQLKENKTFSSSSKRNKSKAQLLRTPWSSKRYIPYSITPKTGQVSRILTKKNPPKVEQRAVLRDTTNITSVNKVTQDLPKEFLNTLPRKKTELIEINEDILSVVGKTWRVYYSSPFYNFDYKISSFQKYQNLLSAHLESNTENGIAFEVGQDFVDGKLKAEFKALKDFSFYDTDYSGVKVTVYSKKTQRAVKKLEAPVLDAVFCCFGSEFDENSEMDCFSSLPVCLVKGPVSLAKCIFSWFEAQFDCRIMPMHFSPMDLSWYASLWGGIVPEASKTYLELCYSVPSAAKGLNRVMYNINAHDAKKLWHCCHKNNSAIFTDDESSSFMKALESHFYFHFRVNLGALSLTRIGNSLVFIGSEGRIKISQAMYVRHILQQITASALDKLALGKL